MRSARRIVRWRVAQLVSTEVVETADRDFVIAEPITYRPPNSSEDRTIRGFSRLVLSARDVARLYVSYVAPEAERDDGG